MRRLWRAERSERSGRSRRSGRSSNARGRSDKTGSHGRLGMFEATEMVLNGIQSSRQKVTKSQEKVISAPRALLELKISYDTQKSSLTDLGYVIHATSIHSPFLHHMHGHIMSRRPQVTGEGLRHIGGVGEGHPA